MAADKTVRALLRYGVEKFESSGISYGHGTTNALDEAGWLILHALGLPPHELNSHLDRPLAESQVKAAKALLDRRVRTRKPAAYLIHEAWLGPHRFYVDERVIVPRSYIAELMREWKAAPYSAVLDLCTGSGCLAILAALKYPRAQVDAADLSAPALEVAKRNVAQYQLEGRVRLVKSDLFSALAGRTYDLIVSNPPYVKAASMKKLPDEYRKEPAMALAGGEDGLDHTRAIIARAREHLKPQGRLVVEIGRNRKALERAFPGLRFQWPKTSAGAGGVFVLERADFK